MASWFGENQDETNVDYGTYILYLLGILIIFLFLGCTIYLIYKSLGITNEHPTLLQIDSDGKWIYSLSEEISQDKNIKNDNATKEEIPQLKDSEKNYDPLPIKKEILESNIMQTEMYDATIVRISL